MPLVSGVRVFKQERDALAASDTRRGDAVALAALAQRAGDGDGEAHAGGGERVSERDGAAVHVELVGVEAELLGDGKRLGALRLVDLEAADVVELQSGAFE